MQIGRLTRRRTSRCFEPVGQAEGSQLADAVSVALGKLRQKVSPQTKHPFLAKVRLVLTFLWAAASILLMFRRNLHSVQRKHSMSNSNGMDPTRLRQLRAMAENLCTLANRHRENHNYVVAHALYGRALSVAQEIRTSENDGNALVARIRTDQQAVFEMLRSGESGPENTSVGESTEGWPIEFMARPNIDHLCRLPLHYIL